MEVKENADPIQDGIALMDSSCAVLRMKLDSIDGEVKTESHGSYTSTIAVKQAVASWNKVREKHIHPMVCNCRLMAMAFRWWKQRAPFKRGIIEEATNTEAPKLKDHAVILAASYSGQTVTELAKM